MITETLEAIGAKLQADGIVTDVLTAEPGTPFTFAGVRYLWPGNTTGPHRPPRIVFVLVNNEHVKARGRRQPQQVPGQGVPIHGREIARTKHNVIAHLWADGKPSGVAHEHALHLLKGQLIEVAQEVCGRGEGGVEVGDETYVDQEGSQLDKGEASLLKMSFQSPVYAARDFSVPAPLQDVSQNGGMTFPGGGEVAAVPSW